MEPLPADWAAWRGRIDVDAYERRWQRLAAAGVETPLQAGRQEGAEGNVLWQVDLRPYITPEETARAAGLQAFWATATVTWRDRRAARPRSLQLTTLKLRRAE